jgi:hypothetical protein
VDAIGTVIRFAGVWPSVARGNWQRKSDGAGEVLWTHRPTSTMFQVYAEGDTDKLVARFIHVCDGAEAPELLALTWYGRVAILLEGMATESLSPAWVKFVPEDADGPTESFAREKEQFSLDL